MGIGITPQKPARGPVLPMAFSSFSPALLQLMSDRWGGTIDHFIHGYEIPADDLQHSKFGWKIAPPLPIHHIPTGFDWRFETQSLVQAFQKKYPWRPPHPDRNLKAVIFLSDRATFHGQLGTFLVFEVPPLLMF
jgi:hypothetical protein